MQQTLQTFQNFHGIFTQFKAKLDANALFFQVCHSQGTPELQRQQHTLVLHKTLLHKFKVSFQTGNDASDYYNYTQEKKFMLAAVVSSCSLGTI